jgi:uncharacterized protein (DUF58 family)
MPVRGGRIRVSLLFAVALVAVAGLLLRSTALVGLAGAWAALVAVSRRRAVGLAGALHAARMLPASGVEDEMVPVEIALDNRGPRSALFTEILDDFGPAIADRQALLEPGPLPGGRRRHLRYRTACSRRWGMYTVGPLRLTTGDPFGLFRVVIALAPPEPFPVFPRLVEMPALGRLGGAPSLAPQERAEARSGQGALVLGVRDYRAGDDVRRMHWPAFARRAAPAVRELERDLLPYLTLFLDLEMRHRAGTGLKSTIEYLVRSAASVLWSASRRGDVAQLFAEGAVETFVPPGRGAVHLADALYELIRVRQEGTTDVLDLVERHRAHVPARSTVVILAAATALDAVRLGAALDAFAARNVTAAVLAVEADSFLPIDRLAASADVVRARRHALLAALCERGAGGAVIGSEDDLPRTLARPDLLDAPWMEGSAAPGTVELGGARSAATSEGGFRGGRERRPDHP